MAAARRAVILCVVCVSVPCLKALQPSVESDLRSLQKQITELHPSFMLERGDEAVDTAADKAGGATDDKKEAGDKKEEHCTPTSNSPKCRQKMRQLARQRKRFQRRNPGWKFYQKSGGGHFENPPPPADTTYRGGAKVPPGWNEKQAECCHFFAKFSVGCETNVETFIDNANRSPDGNAIDVKFKKCDGFCVACKDFVDEWQAKAEAERKEKSGETAAAARAEKKRREEKEAANCSEDNCGK